MLLERTLKKEQNNFKELKKIPIGNIFSEKNENDSGMKFLNKEKDKKSKDFKKEPQIIREEKKPNFIFEMLGSLRLIERRFKGIVHESTKRNDENFEFGFLKKSESDTIANKSLSIKKITNLPNEMDKDIRISRYDFNLIEKINKKEELNTGQHKRLDRLIQEGYVIQVEDKYIYSEKLKNERSELIRNEVLDERETPLLVFKYGKKEFKRRLNRNQIELIKNLKIFGNLTEFQMEDIYGEDAIYLNKDVTKMISTKLICRDQKIIDNKKVWLYHLGNTGNVIGKELTGLKQDSKPFRKKTEEIKHDLMQYDAASYIVKKIKENGGTVEKIILDREKRSNIYKKNFREIGNSNRETITDVEIIAKYGQTTEKLYLEIDRGYKLEIIKNKASKNPNIIWFTDNHYQIKKISRFPNSGIYFFKN